MKAIIACAAVLALVGCATTALPLDQLAPVPAERVTWRDTDHADAGTIVIARDAGFAGSLARTMVAVDGVPAGALHSSEVLRLRVEPGRRVVTASVYERLIGTQTIRPRSLEVTVAPGRATLLRVGFDDGARGMAIWQDVAAQ